MNRYARRILPALAVVAVLGAACGGDADPTASVAETDTTTAIPEPVGTGDKPTSTAAADLRVGLTGLLQEHVYLAGITTGTALSGADFKPAAALAKNTQGLQDAVASVYGEAGGRQFGELWRTPRPPWRAPSPPNSPTSWAADARYRGSRTEGCESGRIGRSRKPLWGQPHRGFKSHPLRTDQRGLPPGRPRCAPGTGRAPPPAEGGRTGTPGPARRTPRNDACPA